MSGHGRAGGRGGFSLIVVLVISIVGMSLLGGMMYALESFSGASRATVSDSARYNILQDGVEKGKAILKARMHNTDPPPRWTDKFGFTISDDIDQASDLLLEGGVVYEGNVNQRDLGGKTGRIKVEIFDMQYNKIASTIDPEELANLPPAYMMSTAGPGTEDAYAKDTAWELAGGSSGQCGIYLIRATLETDGGERKILETSVIQSNLL